MRAERERVAMIAHVEIRSGKLRWTSPSLLPPPFLEAVVDVKVDDNFEEEEERGGGGWH